MRSHACLVGVLVIVGALTGACSRQSLASTPAGGGDGSGPSTSESGAPAISTAKVGQSVTVQCSGIDCLKLTVNSVKFAAKFSDPDGYYDDKPEARGHVFMAVKVTYVALDNAVSYNPLDWSVFANDEAVDGFTFALNGPKPELHSGQLPKGRKASGWILYEVPRKGKVVLSYSPNYSGPPVFEVVLRKR